MLPYSLPSSVSAFGRRQMRAYPYTPQAGDVAWVDFIPVRFVSDNFQEGTYNRQGYVAIDIISSPTGRQAWVDYVPIVIDDTRTDAWLVNRVGYIPVNFSGTGDGTAASKGLSLNFLGATTLDPRITFSRASNATVTGSDGFIRFAPHNLLTHSDMFANAAWTKTNSSITANTTAAPDGTLTADKLVENTATSSHIINLATAVSIPANTAITASVYLKASERTRARLIVANSAYSASARVDVNLSNGTIGSPAALAGSPTNLNASILFVGNGWYRVSLTATLDAVSTSANVQVNINDDAGNQSYTGNGTSGVFIWGAQLEIGTTAREYQNTSVKNLLGFSEAFDNAAWTKSNSSITANATAAPNGTLTADKLVENTANSTHETSISIAVTSGVPYTASVYVKAAERPTISLVLDTGFTESRTWFNLTTLTATTTTGSITSSYIQPVGNGWFRVGVTQTATSTTNANLRFRIWTGTTTVYIGDGTSGVFLWGAQLSASASLDPYVNNPVAAPSSTAYYAPRFDYDPVTLQPRGLLIEEQRTNLVLRSEELNVIPWALQNTTVSANTTTSPDGTVDADKLIEDTATSTHYIANGFTPVNATTYTASVYLKAAERSFAFVGFSGGSMATTFVSVNLSTGAITTAVGTPVSSSSTAVGNGWYRVTISLTSTGTTATNLDIRISTDGLWANRSYTGNGTSGIFVWGAQVEAGAFATSYIPTVAAQVTRSADNALIQGSNFSGWYNQSEGTISTIVNAPKGTVVVGTGNTFNDTQYLAAASSNNLSIRSGGADVAVITAPISTTAITKAAWVYRVNDFRGAVNGTLTNADSSGAVPVDQVRMVIGAASWTTSGGNYLNGWIQSVAYYPRRLSNSELQAITA